MTNAEFGKHFLIGNRNRYRLEISYDNDNAPCLNLCTLEEYKEADNKISFNIVDAKPLDLTSIYEQIANLFNAS